MLPASPESGSLNKAYPGTPWPLGSSITDRGVNFSIAAPDASHIELVLFADPNHTKPQNVFELNASNRSGDYWHIEIEGIKEGCCYCYRISNAGEEQRNHCYSEKLLIDPCARAISGWDVFQRKAATGNSSNEGSCLKGVVCERDKFDFKSHPRPKHPWSKTVIYELHVSSFTHCSLEDIQRNEKGKIKGLIRKIPYLKELGITTIELMPIHAFDQTDSPAGNCNYWGYSPISWFAPHQEYITSKDPLKGRQEIRNFVAACHDEGIEVIVDVVYNHTTEGNEEGPIISWKGCGESLYYYKNKDNQFLDVSGCGNSIAANRPLVRKLILESMRCWACELGVDGFRFDLGIALSRGEKLEPLDNPPLFEEIEADPELSDLKLVSEPWDCGGLYKLKDFPSKKIGAWNGQFRDNVRRFWKGDQNTTWNIKESINSNNFDPKDDEKSHKPLINFITSHDGFTLNDLVTFNSKHNLANGENNRDGDNHNNSWNHGIEGPSTDKNLQALRKRQQKNLLATLLLNPGVPMILMGDEVSRSQGGNNNSWCQNSPLSWMIWSKDKCDLELRLFVTKMLKIRKTIPEIFSPSTPHTEIESNTQKLSHGFSIQWHGVNLQKPDWSDWSHTISYSLHKESDDIAHMWMGLNAYNQNMKFELPKTNSGWEIIVNTAKRTKSKTKVEPMNWDETFIELKNRSLVLALSKEYSSKFD
ncbi:isoamylase [Prochlorococcus sp. MIT 1300]|uniref:glycogen debranching protein n=1 Tax=Prochlorococcus sp. MIT 1300 TaxID=3096218 RepID=UPI002A75B3F8|nr:isoamylase [Prochlorococcus sp. MIT 1300]